MAPTTVLNVAEKPSVARALAGVFRSMPGSVDRGMQRDQGTQIFTHGSVSFPSVHRQGEGRTIHGPMEQHTMITTSVRGHLASQDFGPQYGWSSCAPVALFDAPIETFYRSDMEKLEQMLRRQSQRAQVLILWLDCDREGEAIADEVRTVCLNGNPRLGVYRAKFSTVLPQEIGRALKTLGRINEAFVHAVRARMELDLRVGAAFTRFQSLRLQKKFDGFSDGNVVSYGPCQFPTLGFVVERWARIETFVPEDFWFIELALRVPQRNHAASSQPPQQQQGRQIHFVWKRGRLYDRVATMVLYESCLDAGEAVVTELTGRPKNKWRPVPMATVELQKRASRYLRIGSETLMSAAEQLYQQGYISYPRTETERFRPEFQHQPLIQDFASAGGSFRNYAQKLLTAQNFQLPRAGQHDDKAHPPITPCKAVDPQTIDDPTQRNVYILIVKHYLACCSRDAVGKETLITVRMASEEFTARGLMVLEKNWLEIYEPWERWSTGQGQLPPLQVGSRIEPSALVMKEGRTTPPQPISEVELISLMDRNGIGTDATIAQHISTIQDRAYATKDAAQKFHPTKLGIALVEGYNSMGYQLNKPDLRRETESECNNVALGRKTKDDIMTPLLAKMLQCFQRANQEAHKLDQAVARHYSPLGAGNDTSTELNHSFSECGVCQTPMALKQTIPNRQHGNTRTPMRRKLLYCSTCKLGYGLPRGELQPMKHDLGNTPLKCPICQFQVVQICRGEGYNGNGYKVCPKCFTDPPADHGGSQGGGDFRCFSCTHPQCQLAGRPQGGQVEVFTCPFCSQRRNGGNRAEIGMVMLRKNSRGFVLSCNSFSGGDDRCGYTVWLPRATSDASVPEGEQSFCRRCSTGNRVVRKVSFTWKPGSVPPHLGRECTACILCDAAFRQDVEISLPRMNRVGHNDRRQERNSRVGGGARNAADATNRSMTCYRCGQPGHFANNCPNNARQ